MTGNIIFRRNVMAKDSEAVRGMVARTGFFTDEEIRIAAELVNENLAKGPDASGYFFLFGCDEAGNILGYACYGPIPGSDYSYDLYWIVVDPGLWKQGAGRSLLEKTENLVREAGGRRIYAETSSTARYAPTRAFYEACGYWPEAVLQDFYREGDSKVFFVKEL
jgi:D-alanine-D-alanine ligase